MLEEVVEKHYSKSEVREEIASYCKGRWVALEGSAGEGRVFIRYSKGKPLRIEDPRDIQVLLKRYAWINPRTIYCTLNVYRKLDDPGDLDDPENIMLATPFWDIDVEGDEWKHAVRAAQVICEFLEKEGVRKSVYVLWSGEGAHVRISEKAFSPSLLSEKNPLDIAFAVVEYVLRKLKNRLESLARESGGKLRVENLVDAKRVFTAPLSLHRRLNRVAICLAPDDLASFDISWTSPEAYKHRSVWREYEEGEADELALRALKEVGSILITRRMVVGTPKHRVQTRPRTSGGIGRFQVMGLLQAARYYLLTGDLEKAKSFGLNRAIFYAWAKHYGAGYIPRRAMRRRTLTQQAVEAGVEGAPRPAEPLEDEAIISPRGYFMMGGQEQLPSDYDKNVKEKIEKVIPYEIAWEAALKYVSRFPKHVLQDPQKFYERVYEPVRDTFIEKVVKETVMEETRSEPEKTQTRITSREKTGGETKKKTLLDWLMKSSENEKQ